MKKKYMAIALALSLSTFVTGCSSSSVPSVKEMMVGEDTESLDYDPVECVEVPAYKGVEVDCTVSEDEIQKEIDTLLANNKIKIKKGNCKLGDTVNIDYSGKRNGKKFDGGTAEDQTITLGESGMIDGFDDAIIGMKVGDKKDAKMTFPKDYHDEKLAGKDVVFTLKLNYIMREAALDDAFIKKNTDYDSVSAYKEGTKKILAEEKKNSAGYTAFQKIMEGVTVKNVPQSMTDKWTKIITSDMEAQAKQYGMDVDTMASYYGMEKDAYIKQSTDNQIKQVLVVQYIMQKEGIEVTEQDIKDDIKKACEQAGQEEAAYRKSFDEYYNKAQTLEEFIKFNLQAQKLLELLKENVKIKE